MATNVPELGRVLVVGGCGLVGYHIVRRLLETEGCGPVWVISRNPTRNIQEGAFYSQCDISSHEAVSQRVQEFQPNVIFHTAAPISGDAIPFDEYHQTSVIGTENLLKCASATASVKAFVYTSSTRVFAGYDHVNVDEDFPLWDTRADNLPYIKSKTMADFRVLQRNKMPDAQGQGVLTVSLRPYIIYGECDRGLIPALLEVVTTKRTNFQIGKGGNMTSPSYAGNIAIAHILAAEKLLGTVTGLIQKDVRVDGEAFIINDGQPIPFWEFNRIVWRHAGDTTRPEDVRVIPAWLALAAAFVIKWLFKICTLGRIQPPIQMTQLAIRSTIYNSTYSIEKARKRLGFNPVADHDKNLKLSVDWELEHNHVKWKNLKGQREL